MPEKASILVVDDEPSVRRFFARDLAKHGYKVSEAEDGASALEMLRHHDIGVALIDLNMPGMDGFALLEAMREEHLATIPIVLTAESHVSNAVKATKLGAFDFLPKPSDLDTVALTVERAFRHREALVNAKTMASLATEWKQVFDASPDLIVVTDSDFRVVKCNKAVLDRLGKTEEELIGRVCPEALCGKVLHPGFCPSAQPERGMNSERFAAGAYHEVLGGYFDCSWSSLHDKSSNLVGFLHILHDVTERKEAGNALRSSEEKFRQIVDNVGIGVTLIGSDMRILDLNRQMREWFPEVRLQDKPLCHNALNDPPREEVCGGCPVAATLRDGLKHEGTTTKNRGGSTHSYHVISSPIHDSDGNVVAVIEALEDTTERLNIERELQQSQKLESVGRLAAGIAHEINTPIQYVGDNTRFLQDAFTGILALITQLTERVKAHAKESSDDPFAAEVQQQIESSDLEYLSEEVPKAITQTLEGIARVAKIVLAMKEFSHPGSSEKTDTNINKAIESTVTVCRNEWKYVADLETDFDLDLPLVPCLPGDFNQVILNLIVNAVHAIEDAVKEKTGERGKITISTRRVEKWVEIRLTDTGGGIPENVRDRIFDPFFTTKEVGRGTGQGLAIARSVIVDKHGGSIAFETEIGRGTTFIIRLPLGEGV